MIVLGLGTNMGDRQAHLRQAITLLGSVMSSIQCSPVYESIALLPEGAPKEWDKPFLNMAVRGDTTLAPRALLNEIKTIERTVGRLARGHWGPREIDIDILAYGDILMDEPDLVIPHAHVLARDFALVPFADIAPTWAYPRPGEHHAKTARELTQQLKYVLNPTDIKLP